MVSWFLCGSLLVACVFLLGKLLLMKKSLDEICASLMEHRSIETNTLISISSNDPHVKKLASEINVELRFLRRERRRFQNGDNELQEAITIISHDLKTP